MKQNVNVLVVDNNSNVTSEIKKKFSSHAVINVVKTINNGQDALDYVINNSKAFDVLIMDIILPELDGVTILQRMKELNIRKKVIVLTGYKKEYGMSLVEAYSISYYMLKPFSMLALETRILELGNQKAIKIKELSDTDKEIHMAITKLLHKLGIPSHIKGYNYIRESVYLLYKDSDLYSGITKDIYPKVATKYSTTTSRVERAIRHAIEVSWGRGDYDVMEEIFGNSVALDRDKPTNAEFIATLADRLRYDEKLLKL